MRMQHSHGDGHRRATHRVPRAPPLREREGEGERGGGALRQAPRMARARARRSRLRCWVAALPSAVCFCFRHAGRAAELGRRTRADGGSAGQRESLRGGANRARGISFYTTRGIAGKGRIARFLLHDARYRREGADRRNDDCRT